MENVHAVGSNQFPNSQRELILFGIYGRELKMHIKI